MLHKRVLLRDRIENVMSARQADRWTDKQLDRQTDGQTNS